ncbi:5'-methylthioadenosine/S-adenosylhomocysteine nucleosidase family protein [Epilithonimonas tenax]|uniref:5'-methylthioadenosine/S-adenosylhomocysteine nucleosidase family protein n=1 Tax=Epilithonimonas tenax TaxID=191577 RepID=UPI001377420F|nr:hypothetical protein [Epilithonimonas tenax]
MSKVEYLELDFKNIEYLVDDNLLLLVTATELETLFTHEKLAPLPKYNSIIKCHVGNLTYYFGIFGKYKVVHVQCSMGSVSPSSSILTVKQSLELFKSKALIMVGIAFGIDKNKQNIGDVLVAESVLPYESQRIGESDTIQRGIEIPSSQLLLNRFKNIQDWNYQLSDSKNSEIIFTRVMSGEILVDNLEYREMLKGTYPDSKGGEMEGAGVYSACSSSKTDCILVKGICDFADGEKGKDKHQNQRKAISSALNLCSSLFMSETAFKELNILPFAEKLDICQEDISNVLFDFYDHDKEKFYIERNRDNDFIGVLNQFGVWIHGPSGCGKSNLIARNLINNKKEYIQIDLSPCIGQSIEILFDEILYEIADRVGSKIIEKPANFNECSKKILTLLEENFFDKDIVIFIEEIPISSVADQKEFAEKLFSLLISKNFKRGLSKVKFVLSCIDNPTKYITSFQQKVYQQFTFLELDYWNETEINSLLELILKELNLNINRDVVLDLVKRAKGSPRFVKKFIRSVISVDKFDEETLTYILGETEREFK